MSCTWTCQLVLSCAHNHPASQMLVMSADAPCARECTQEVYPTHGNFDACHACGKSHPFLQADLGSIEIVFEVNYTRGSLLLGGVQSTLSTTCVSLLEEEGMTVCQSLPQPILHLHLLACIACLFPKVFYCCMLQSNSRLATCSVQQQSNMP